MKKACLAALLLLGCSPESLDDFQREGERWSQEMCRELEGIETREILLAHLPRLAALYDELAELLIAARRCALGQEGELTYQNRSATALRPLLERVYALEGGREIIERAQRGALEKLALFEQEIEEESFEKAR